MCKYVHLFKLPVVRISQKQLEILRENILVNYCWYFICTLRNNSLLFRQL